MEKRERSAFSTLRENLIPQFVLNTTPLKGDEIL
jgi:hypothetical protein